MDWWEVPLQRLNSQPTSLPCSRVILDKTIDLPPHSESLAPVKIEGYLLTNGKWGILESDSSHSIDGVMTGRTLLDLEKSTVPVRILNLMSKEKRIKKGLARIAINCHSLSDHVHGQGDVPTQDVPDKSHSYLVSRAFHIL